MFTKMNNLTDVKSVSVFVLRTERANNLYKVELMAN